MAASPSISTLAAEGEDSECEYEYHETETESFYVTLDISSAADYNSFGNKRQKPESSLREPPQPTTSLGAQDNAGPSERPADIAPEIMDIDPALEQPEDGISFSEPKDRIQILDFHAQNPLISYRNQLYSCEWTSTLGTDMILIAPVPDFPHPVLREEPNVSVLAASSIKLMGRPAHLVSRHSTEEGAQTSTPAPEKSTASANGPREEQSTPFKIPLGATPSRARQNQANFLERLIAIKAKKVEKDNVTIYTQKVNQGTGWRSQRKASEAISDGEDENQPKQSRRGSGTGGRPRGSRRMRGPRTAKGGLFRDYRPQLWDTPGADIRAGPSSTPESWDQLEGGASDGKQTPVITTASASPLPGDQRTQTASRSTRALSASASAHASPTPSFPPVQSIVNIGDISAGNAAPSPSLAPSSGPQPAIVAEEDAVPVSSIPDVEIGDFV